jgi:biopolymer transport protein ExbD
MRLYSIYSRRRDELSLQMTPMIDVVFQLLVFFVWTCSFQIVENTLPSQLAAVPGHASPAADLPPERDFDDVVVRILWRAGRPAWRVNGAPAASLPAVRRTLAGIARIKPDAPIVLHPDQEVPLGGVIDVYDLCRLQGFQKIQFVASLPDG